MANRRAWASLSDAYRDRLFRSGITATDYANGASLKAARGHSVTPERPKQAFRNPDLYSGYLRRRVARGKEVPEGTLPEPRPSRGDDDPTIDGSIGWPGRDTVDNITFYRSRDGAKNGADGIMTVTSFNPDGTVRSVKTYEYNQRDFYRLIDLARSRGFGCDVESTATALIA
jgi:hypothetical protein